MAISSNISKLEQQLNITHEHVYLSANDTEMKNSNHSKFSV